MNNPIDIKAESLPWPFKLVGILLIVAALAVVGKLWWLSLIFVFIGLLILTTHSGTEIDYHAKIYREYNSFLFFRFGKKLPYESVERIFINAGKDVQQTQTAHTTSGSIFTFTTYNAYLKLSNGKKIFLVSKRNKEVLIKLLRPAVEALQTELVDYTTS